MWGKERNNISFLPNFPKLTLRWFQKLGMEVIPANMQDYSTHNKSIFFSIHKQIGQLPVRQHCINHFIIAKENGKPVIGLKRDDMLQEQYPACICLFRRETYWKFLLVHGKQSNLKLHCKINVWVELLHFSVKKIHK